MKYPYSGRMSSESSTIYDTARAIAIHWHELGKCHRLEQLFRDRSEFMPYVASYYRDVNWAANHPSKLEVANELLRREVPGFAEAIIALDAHKSHVRRLAPRAAGWAAHL